MHGGTPANIINRLVTKYLMAMPSLGIDVTERIIGSSVDYICIQDAIPNIGRKVTIIAEVTYDYEKNRVDLKPIYKFDFASNSFKKMNNISPEKIDTMFRRGVKAEEVTRWVD